MIGPSSRLAAMAQPAQEDVVYGAHPFEAENEDELSFGRGERIVVLQRDEEFGDGWYEVSRVARGLSTAGLSLHGPTRVPRASPGLQLPRARADVDEGALHWLAKAVG